MSRVSAAIAVAIALCLSTLSALGADPKADAPVEGPPIWRISDGDSAVWLIGSIHLLPEGVSWDRPTIDDAFAASDITYFEASIDDANDPDIARMVAALGVNPPGVVLRDQLSREGRTRLTRLARTAKISEPELDRLRPWLAYIVLETGLFQAAGATVEAGVDAILEARARAEGKEIRFLETPADQIRVLADLSPVDQLVLLERALIAFEDRPSTSDDLVEAWRSGDDAALESMIFDGSEELPAFFDALFTQRNTAWAETIATLLQENEAAVLIVGAGHLVGPAGVPRLLRQEGLVVERR